MKKLLVVLAMTVLLIPAACGNSDEAQVDETQSQDVGEAQALDVEEPQASEIDNVACCYREIIAFVSSGEIDEMIIQQMETDDEFSSEPVIAFINEEYNRIAAQNGFISAEQWRELRTQYMDNETIAAFQSELEMSVDELGSRIPADYQEEVVSMTRSSGGSEPVSSGDQDSGSDDEPSGEGDDNATMIDWEIGYILDQLK